MKECPEWLWTPGTLMKAHWRGKYVMPLFLRRIEEKLLDLASGNIRRLMVNVPFQHGKTALCTLSFISWSLLTKPHLRVLMGAHETMYARMRGGEIRDMVSEWGQRVGVSLKEDTQDKSEWIIDEYGGGLVSRGMRGSIQGRPCDLLVVEDPYKSREDVIGPNNEQRWYWYSEVAYARLSRDAPILVVSTRWGKNDLCGRIQQEAKKSGEEWTIIKYAALAKENDDLGRQPDEALWEDMKPRRTLEVMRSQNPTWFAISYQQEDGEGEGRWFKVRRGYEEKLRTGEHEDLWHWPFYRDLHNGGAYSCDRIFPATGRKIWTRGDLLVYVVLDWAYGKKKWADYTAMGAFGLTPSGDLLILDMVHARFGVSELAPALASFCQTWRPFMAAAEQGHPTLRDQCAPYREIPEMRWLSHRNQSKLQRAMEAIARSDNKKLFLPVEDAAWREPFVLELMSFTGEEDGTHDDQVDCLAYACNLARELRAQPRSGADWPCVLTPGREVF